MTTDGRRSLGWRDLTAGVPSGARVLVVEDDPDVRRALDRILTRLGYHTREAKSAEEADRWLEAERFELCLLDIELPRMSGIEFLGWAQKRDPEMAVIMLTGVDVPEVAVECMEAGARTYLVKPIQQDFLRIAIRDALAMRALLVERNRLAARRGS